MKIAENTFVAIDYCLTLDSGEEVDRSQMGQPLTFITGTGQIIPGLEQALTGMKAGDTAKVTVEAADAYGPAREDLMQEVPRSHFPADTDIQPGMTFQADGPQGPFMILVKTVTDETVTVDLNHPMAGQRLHFDVTVQEVREASADDLAAIMDDGGCGCGCGDDEEGGCGCGGGGEEKSSCGSGCGCS